MIRAVDTVSKVLGEYVVKARESYRAEQIKNKKQWAECERLVNETKANFANIVERVLRRTLDKNPMFAKNMFLDIMPIPRAVIEEHIRTSGSISGVRSSKVPMLQELVDLAKKEGLEPCINTYNAVFQVTIPEELMQKVLEESNQ